MEDRVSAISRTRRVSSRELPDAGRSIQAREECSAGLSNRLSLRKIHHAAFNKNIPGINEDYPNELRQNTLKEVDSPMITDSPQGLHHQKLFLQEGKVIDRERRVSIKGTKTSGLLNNVEIKINFYTSKIEQYKTNESYNYKRQYS